MSCWQRHSDPGPHFLLARLGPLRPGGEVGALRADGDRFGTLQYTRNLIDGRHVGAVLGVFQSAEGFHPHAGALGQLGLSKP
jgi:hypothetical protein